MNQIKELKIKKKKIVIEEIRNIGSYFQ